jgi:hypothetical protein
MTDNKNLLIYILCEAPFKAVVPPNPWTIYKEQQFNVNVNSAVGYL